MIANSVRRHSQSWHYLQKGLAVLYVRACEDELSSYHPGHKLVDTVAPKERKDVISAHFLRASGFVCRIGESGQLCGKRTVTELINESIKLVCFSSSKDRVVFMCFFLLFPIQLYEPKKACRDTFQTRLCARIGTAPLHTVPIAPSLREHVVNGFDLDNLYL